MWLTWTIQYIAEDAGHIVTSPSVLQIGKIPQSCAFVHMYIQSEVSILGPVGYRPTTLPLRHSDCMSDLHS
ncbi:hypothetical protein MPTK1_6g17760 [Marchantia polymorpha subsp. ruderalis]|uniref:Uncharacterized protein n=2 Tax=Marchantia polymorpha TaxID=3197 RepID=A0AAF6BT58_MARPO|nr:hypothetical protein MARPO_0145s0010 [Marchantia polymorpha]BBN15192.1 hypothetical protein Mp_6g17760 [Marchantia polymorpha subsp. ruderalis]|eukprot:PTQ29242.1 hypothetical protein MARPO_0145s0010 [Marchantia polymorpha]